MIQKQVPSTKPPFIFDVTIPYIKLSLSRYLEHIATYAIIGKHFSSLTHEYFIDMDLHELNKLTDAGKTFFGPDFVVISFTNTLSPSPGDNLTIDIPWEWDHPAIYVPNSISVDIVEDVQKPLTKLMYWFDILPAGDDTQKVTAAMLGFPTAFTMEDNHVVCFG